MKNIGGGRASMKNRVCELLGIDYPIIMGGMIWVGTAEMASAVSNAGALGIVAAGHLSPADLRAEIRWARQITDKPFGVNIPLRNPWAADWTDKGRASWFGVVIEEKVPVVFTSAGNPDLHTWQLKNAGVKVVHVVSTVAQAIKAEQAGVDAVVTEGFEAGGHNSFDELSTMVLVPQVVDAVKIPVIAAGGIADARGFVAALALGAEAVQMGTRFIATKDAQVHREFKQALVSASDTGTTIIGHRLGPMRMIKNDLASIAQELESNGISGDDLIAFLSGGRTKMALVDGDIENGLPMAGQVAGLIHGLLTAKEVVDTIVADSHTVLQTINSRAIDPGHLPSEDNSGENGR